MFRATIRWGSNAIEERDRCITTTDFKTQAELVAYLEGVDDASGWMDYEILDNDVEDDDLWDEPENLSNVPITP